MKSYFFNTFSCAKILRHVQLLVNVSCCRASLDLSLFSKCSGRKKNGGRNGGQRKKIHQLSKRPHGVSGKTKAQNLLQEGSTLEGDKQNTYNRQPHRSTTSFTSISATWGRTPHLSSNIFKLTSEMLLEETLMDADVDPQHKNTTPFMAMPEKKDSR